MRSFRAAAVLAGCLLHVAACSNSDSTADAMAASKLDAHAALAALATQQPAASPIELELEMDGDQPVYNIDAVTQDGVRTFTVNAVTGAIAEPESVTLSDREKFTLDAWKKLKDSRRLALADALRQAEQQAGKGRAVEADLEMDGEDDPVFTIQVQAGNESRKVKVPAEKPD